MSAPEKPGAKEVYPPTTNYEWQRLEDFNTADQATLADLVRENYPSYTLQNVLKIMSRHEAEKRILELVLDGSLLRLLYYPEHNFPVIIEGSIAKPVVNYMPLSSSEDTMYGFGFLKHKSATEDQYNEARAMYITTVNSTLKFAERKTIPPIITLVTRKTTGQNIPK